MKGQSPDFAALCDKYPELAACAKRRRTDGDDKGTSTTPTFDWTDERTLRTLTEVLLRDEFDVHMVLPADRLTPPVPNRANYIHWLHTALLAGDDASPHHVLDVGVGASCIYPLIGAATHGSWTFHGTDVDARSLQHAEDNVARNPRLRERIQLSLVAPCEALQRAVTQALVLRPPCPTGAGPITTALASFCDGDARRGGRGPIRRALEAAGRVADVKACETAYYDDPSPCVTQPAALQDDALYSVVMTNPPFYDVGEAVAPSPLTVCTGAVHEAATPGGEVAFVAAMLADSLVLRRRVRWYTAMLGKVLFLRFLSWCHLFIHTPCLLPSGCAGKLSAGADEAAAAGRGRRGGHDGVPRRRRSRGRRGDGRRRRGGGDAGARPHAPVGPGMVVPPHAAAAVTAVDRHLRNHRTSPPCDRAAAAPCPRCIGNSAALGARAPRG